MEIKDIHRLEEAMILLLNFEGWDLKHSGNGKLPYDAIGKTQKGYPCIIEMKFRKKHYDTKMLEKGKYDTLMAMDDKLVKIYLVNDEKGNFMYYLNELDTPPLEKKRCPRNTIWKGGKEQKEVYMLKENDAIRININKPLRPYEK